MERGAAITTPGSEGFAGAASRMELIAIAFQLEQSVFELHAALTKPGSNEIVLPMFKLDVDPGDMVTVVASCDH